MSTSPSHAASLTGSGHMNAVIQHIMDKADIQIGGDRPWDIQIHYEETIPRIIAERSIGLGESYMDGWWDCEALDEFCYRILHAGADDIAKNRIMLTMQAMGYFLRNRQNIRRARQVAEQHYDLDNHLFELMLGRTMAYSCAYWQKADTLDEAQDAKLDLICRKLELEPGMSFLDIGCGWGSLVEYATKHYGVTAVGITVSKEQAELARERCKGLPVDIILEDYRELKGRFDRIASVGMFEHVGRRNYSTYIQTAERLLKDDGLMLLHCIGNNQSEVGHDPWIEKYIFPNGELPSIKQIAQAVEGHFIVEDLHNFGPDYARTLKAWDDNFIAHWDKLKDRYNERFYRMWRYYLNLCVGAFRTRNIELWQWVLSKPQQRHETYQSVR